MGDPSHEFDFWLGDWAVRTPDGKLAGHNRITSISRRPRVREEWRGQGGLVGTSLNIWSSERAAWHQTWIDLGGTVCSSMAGCATA